MLLNLLRSSSPTSPSRAHQNIDLPRLICHGLASYARLSSLALPDQPNFLCRPAQSVTMPALLESAVPPPPHLHLSTNSPWPSYNSHCYGSSASSPTPMTPESLNTFVPRLHDSPLPSQEAVPPSSTWFGTSVSAPDVHSEVSHFSLRNPRRMLMSSS